MLLFCVCHVIAYQDVFTRSTAYHKTPLVAVSLKAYYTSLPSIRLFLCQRPYYHGSFKWFSNDVMITGVLPF